MIGWILFVLLAVLLAGMTALDYSPRQVFRAGLAQIADWWARIKRARQRK